LTGGLDARTLFDAQIANIDTLIDAKTQLINMAKELNQEEKRLLDQEAKIFEHRVTLENMEQAY
jgi:phosphopantothenate synthetase